MPSDPSQLSGADVWREENEWPLPRATYVSYYLRGGPSGSVTSLNDGALSTEPPAQDAPATRYTYPDWEWKNGVVATGPDGRPDPAPGDGYYYLVRAQTACATGTYGFASGPVERTPTSACP